MTLVTYLGLKLTFPLPSLIRCVLWCFVHVCWQLDRYVPIKTIAPYQVLCGHEYQGRIAAFAEPVLAFVATGSQQKGSAK